ncbi:TPA: dephospho-CoA kinase [Candidatus Latescibacteria bacterium]|nr:dephospho-CoA kinase [Candidatus Latescibacterota bacterium]
MGRGGHPGRIAAAASRQDQARTRMTTIGVTGGIGSGKSTVCRMFEGWGADRIDADQVGHESVEDPEVQERLVDAFGADILVDGVLNRRELGKRAFVSDKMRRQLTDVVWPDVGRRLSRRVASARERGVETFVIEASVLLERGDPECLYDVIVVVTAPDDIRIARTMDRLGVSEAEVRARMQHQVPEDEKIKRADHVVVNDGTVDDLEAQARVLWEELKEMEKE